MSRSSFEQDLQIFEHANPDIVATSEALGAVDVSDFDAELIMKLRSATASELWYAAQEAMRVENGPMLGLIALTAHYKSSGLKSLASARESLGMHFLRSAVAVGLEMEAENFDVIYEAVYNSNHASLKA